MEYKDRLERNLKLYYLRGIFERRPYLPIITIYATAISGVSFAQIGIIAAISAFVSLVVEVPSGYLSDKFGHKKALLLGSLLMVLSAFSYVLWQNFFGACMGLVIFWTGAAFHSGTIQAFIHETLRELNRDEEFADIAARERRWAMVGNIFLVAIVPLTYGIISPTAPFIIGAIIHACAFISYMFMTTPRSAHQEVLGNSVESFWTLLSSVKERKEIMLFVFLGIITASGNRLPHFRELYFQEIGVPLWALGLILSITGIVTIVFTYGVPYVKKIKPIIFYGFDFLILGVTSILIGFISQPILGVLLFVSFGGYRRVRSIIIHTNLLNNCPTKKLKATYLSIYEFFSALSGIWLPLLLGYAIGYFGLQGGYLTFGIIFFIIVLPMYLIIYRNTHK